MDPALNLLVFYYFIWTETGRKEGHMNVDGKPMRPIWLDVKRGTVRIIDQRRLPHELVIMELAKVSDAVLAIKEMAVRGAPLIGVTAAAGVYLAVRQDPGDPDTAARAGRLLKEARPTAVNLAWAVDRMLASLAKKPSGADPIGIARDEVTAIAEEEVENCRNIGEHGLALITAIRERKSRPSRQRVDPLQCRLAGLRRIRYGHRPGLRRP